MTLEQEYTNETSLDAYDIFECCYSDQYVEWLEEKIDALTKLNNK